MNRIPSVMAALLVLLVMASGQDARAEYSVLSGRLHGNEPKAWQNGHGCGNSREPLGYAVVAPLTVTESGRYQAASANWDIGLDVYFAIYEGSFNPERPEQNLRAQQDLESWWWDTPVTVQLQADVEYQLIAAPWCFPEKGTWTLLFKGPGTVQSAQTVTGLDSFLRGRFAGESPAVDIGCGAGEFQASGPHRVIGSGAWYFVDASLFFGNSVCLGVYDRPFDAKAPLEGQVALAHGYYAPLEFAADRDYYFVASAHDPAQRGEFMYLLIPRGDVYIDPVLSGAWYDPTMPGQGFFVDVLGHANQLFLGWFTWDLDRPAATTPVQIGDAGQRWLTASGAFRDAAATLEVTLTSGGIFAQAEPAPANQPYGQLNLRFLDCGRARLEYELANASIVGSMPVQRISMEAVGDCETLMQRAGKPRTLAQE